MYIFNKWDIHVLQVFCIEEGDSYSVKHTTEVSVTTVMATHGHKTCEHWQSSLCSVFVCVAYKTHFHQ